MCGVMLDPLFDTHREVRALAREVAQAEIAPRAEGWNARREVPLDAIAQLAELGLLGVTAPEEYGGAGLDVTALCVVVEEIARADVGVSVAIAAHSGLTVGPIVRFGTAEQREQLLPDLASGRRLGAYALSESDAGSDPASMRTTARREDGSWVMDGAKMWITNGGFADLFVVFARTGETGPRGISAFIAERGPGLNVGREIPKMGLHSSSTVELAFDGLRLDADRLLGEEGGGLAIALSTLDSGRIVVAAQACGIAGAALELSVEYASERSAFGGPIGRFQGVQFPLADIAARLDAARLLTLHAASLADAGLPHSAPGAKAKLVSSRLAVDAADVAVQTLGGYGYSAEFPAERLYRDAKITEIYEGTSQIQRLVIARDLLGDAARGGT